MDKIFSQNKYTSFIKSIFNLGKTIFIMVLVVMPLSLNYAQSNVNTNMQNPTLLMLLKLALKNSPGLSNVRYSIQSSKEKLLAAEYLRIPKIQFSGDGFYSPILEMRLIPGVRLGAGKPDGLSMNEIFNDKIIELSPTLSLPIYTGGEISGKVNAAEANSQISNTRYILTRDHLLLSITAQYFNLLKIRQAIKATNASIKALIKSRKFKQEQVRYGKALPVDLYRIDTRLSELQVGLLEEKNHYKTSIDNLSALVGTTLPGNLQPADTLAYKYIPLSIEDSTKILKNSPFNQLSLFGLKYAEAQKTLQQSGLLPKINLIAKYSFYWGNNAVNSPNYNNNNKDFIAILQIRFPIFNFQIYKKIEAASYSALASSERMRQTEYNVKRDFHLALFNEQTAEKSIKVAENSIRTAKEAFRIQQERYNVGKITVDNLIDAEAGLLKARLKYINSVTNYYLSIIQVLRIKGNISLNDLAVFTK